jgi:hypothetical protein
VGLTIGTITEWNYIADGVALAAIQGLNQKLEEKDARITAMEKELSEIKDTLSKLTNKKN